MADKKADKTGDKRTEKPQRLLWLDMEMTGLDVSKEVIIEVAALVTNFDFMVLDRYEAVIAQPQHYLDNMDDWNKKHHKESGLIDRLEFGIPQNTVESELIAFTEKHFPKERAIIAGNSISQDRLFIDKYMPRFAAKLHYRMLDVSSWKVVFQGKYGLKFDKKNAHRAVDDIYESLDELKYYLSYLKI